MSSVPIPPTIPGTQDVKTISASTIKFDGTTLGDVGFYGQTPVEQQDPPTPVINVTPQSNYEMIQSIIESLQAYGLYTTTESPNPPSSRTVTFNNLVSTTAINVYVTVGGTNPSGPTLLTTLPATSGTHVWNIPNTLNWSGNFQFWPVTSGPTTQPQAGSTLIEMGLNQKWKGLTELRDTFDISEVPPGLGSEFANGPRDGAIAFSAANGFNTQQSQGYSVGLTITPPNSSVSGQPALPTFPSSTIPYNTVGPAQNTWATSANYNAIGAITYPNDTLNTNPTGFPLVTIYKQQTGYAVGNYVVDIQYVTPTSFV
jgi:hypothetical protein